VSTVDTGTTLLECDDVSKIYCDEFKQRRKYALRDILFGAPRHGRLRPDERFAVHRFSVTVKAGENVAVLGLPGAGKTILARLVTRMSRPDGGMVRVRGRVGLVFSGRLGMNPFLSVDEYVRLAAAIHGAEPDMADACCEEALHITGLLDRRHATLVNLPKGDVRHLSLAVALTVPQDVRVFDSLPNLGRDPVGTRLAARVRERFTRGSNLILARTTTGLPNTVSRAIILHDGETLYQGRSETVVPIYEDFVNRVARIRRADQARREADPAPTGHDDETGGGVSVGAATVEVPSPTELIARAVQSLDRSHIASLAEEEVAQAWASDRPIILGPFLSDVAFELLYWRPWVAWMRASFGPRRAPVVALSRGRVDAWYSGLASEYVDVCDLVPFETYQARNRERIRDAGTNKQNVVSGFEQDLLDQVTRRLGTGNAAVVHPSVLFRVCSKIWRGVVPSEWLFEHARYERFETSSDAAPAADVSAPYVAASFWFNACFSDSPLHRRVVRDVLAELSQRADVVVIDPGGGSGLFDSLPVGDRIRVMECAESDKQLREQARLIAGARAFVGTFGSLSMMAPFYNVPTSLLYGAEAGLFPQHAAVSHGMASAMPDVPYELTKIANFDAGHLGAWVDRILG
jgi:ABC-type polysaccharide/polyol phosphate transport system ATPase subunit